LTPETDTALEEKAQGSKSLMTLERERWETFRRKHSKGAVVRHRPVPDPKQETVVQQQLAPANVGRLDTVAPPLSQPQPIRNPVVVQPYQQPAAGSLTAVPVAPHASAAPAVSVPTNPPLTSPPSTQYKHVTANPATSPSAPAAMPAAAPMAMPANRAPFTAPLASPAGPAPDPIALQMRADSLSRRSLWVALLAAGIGAWLFMKSGGTGITEGREQLLYWGGVFVACLLGVRPLLGKELAHQGLSGLSPLAWGFVCLAWPALVASMFVWAIGQHAGVVTTLLLLIPALLILRMGLYAMMHVGSALSMRSPWPSPVSPAFSGWGSGWMWLGLIATILLDIGLLRGASLMPSLTPTLSNLISPANDMQVAEAPVEAPVEVPAPHARRSRDAQDATRHAQHQAAPAPAASSTNANSSSDDFAQPPQAGVGAGPRGTSAPRGTPSLPPAPAALPSLPSNPRAAAPLPPAPSASPSLPPAPSASRTAPAAPTAAAPAAAPPTAAASPPPAPGAAPSAPSTPRAAPPAPTANAAEPSPAKPDAAAPTAERAKSAQLLAEARALDKAGKTDQAVLKLEAAVQADPSNADTTMALARGQRLTNQYEKENRTLRKVIELQPNHSSALMALGDSQLRLRGTDKKTVDEAANYYVASYKNASDRKAALQALRNRAEEDGTGRSLAASRALDLIDAD